MRKMDPMKIIRCKLTLDEAGIDASPTSIEKFYEAGGDPQLLARALVVAQERGVTISFDDAARSELSQQSCAEWFGMR